MRNYNKKISTEPSAKKNFNFETLYKHTHDEMTLQQSKRDQIITVYLAMISFIVPFAFSLSGISSAVKGLLLLCLTVVGFIFAMIVVRYRVYKDCYWLGCQTLTQLTNYDAEKINKNLVQSVFYNVLYKKYHKMVDFNNQSINKFLVFTKNIFSAETLYFTILSFVTSTTALLGFLLLTSASAFGIVVSIILFLLLLFLTHYLYVINLCKVFAVLIYHNDNGKNDKIADNLFNYTFSKSWTLHFYLDEE